MPHAISMHPGIPQRLAPAPQSLVLAFGSSHSNLQRRSMDEFSKIAQQLSRFSPDALVVTDPHGLIRYANETVAEVLGYTPAELIGQPLDLLVPERLRSRHGAHVAGYLQQPRNREMGVRIADLSARRKDGSEFPAGIRLAPFKLDGQLYVVAAVRDMTERTRIHGELVAAREEADRANRAKSRFLATASHDLRQPLQAVRLLNASLQRMVRDSEVVDLLEQQEQAIDSMTRLLNGLLDISRLESGSIELHRVEVHLREVLEELCTAFDPLARAKALRLDFQTLNVVLMTDRVLFGQLIENLVGNAVKYTDSGQVAIRCAVDGEGLTIEIEDTGVGIPEDKIERIFDEYYQVDVHGVRRAGVGLGLAIVREVARLLGYSIKVSSRVGVGTRVRISIPHQHLVARPEPIEPATAADKAGDSAQKARVILVEDNDGVRRATELFLKLEGHETLSAATAQEAEVLFSSACASDILIADYHLDGHNTGLDLVSRIRERLGVELPAVVLSGDLPAVLRTLKSAVPNCRFLSKPVDANALIEAIRELSGNAADPKAASAATATRAATR